MLNKIYIEREHPKLIATKMFLFLNYKTPQHRIFLI